MILEVAILDVMESQTPAFEIAFKEAETIIRSMNGYINHALKRCIEKSNRY